MHGLNQRLAAAFLAAAWVCGAAGISRADDAADAKQAAGAFVRKLAQGDAGGAKGYMTPDAAEGDAGKFVDALATMLAGRVKFNQAAIAKFGEQAKLAGADPTQQMLAQIDQAIVNVSGDTAALSHADDPNPLQLRKINGTWKVMEVAPPDKLRQATPLLQSIAAAEMQTAREIVDGKYPTYLQARAALGAKVQASATAPTTVPAHPQSP